MLLRVAFANIFWSIIDKTGRNLWTPTSNLEEFNAVALARIIVFIKNFTASSERWKHFCIIFAYQPFLNLCLTAGNISNILDF